MRPVNVVVPVYNQLALVRQCLSSVLLAYNTTPYEITVIDDASDERGVSYYLRHLAATGRINLIRNECNSGFVCSANTGIYYRPEMDVLLLNSDTVVYDHWLDSLSLTASMDPKIATVNPLTNQNGSHISCYPSPNWHDSSSLEVDDAELHEIAGGVNAGCMVYVHTTVGFCMFIRRDTIKEIGAFDQKKFPFGYGEESDFCYRASKLGWRHAICGDVYVTHLGGSSFGKRKDSLMRAMLAEFRKLHPEQPNTDELFYKLDPLRNLRENLDLGRLKRLLAGRRFLVLTSVSTIDDLARMVDIRLEIEESRILFRFATAQMQSCYPNLRRYDIMRDVVRLNRDLRYLGVNEIRIASEVSFTRFEQLAQGSEVEIGLEAVLTRWDRQFSLGPLGQESNRNSTIGDCCR